MPLALPPPPLPATRLAEGGGGGTSEAVTEVAAESWLAGWRSLRLASLAASAARHAAMSHCPTTNKKKKRRLNKEERTKLG